MAILWPNGLTDPPTFSWEGHFGWRDADLSYASHYHRGLDMIGFSTVRAIADGVVMYVGRRAGWEGGGYMVWIQHDGFFSRSLHLEEGSAVVEVGQHVAAGDALATMGATNGGGYGMAVHLHLEITPGAWHAGNFGQVDPRAFLEERVTGDITTGAGGSAGAPTIQSEEDDVKLYRVTPKGRHYAVAPGFIKQITGKESVKAYEAAAGVKEAEINGDQFTVVLGVNGISTVAAPVVDGQGRILDERDPSKGYVAGGSWARTDKAERFAYEAKG